MSSERHVEIPPALAKHNAASIGSAQPSLRRSDNLSGARPWASSATSDMEKIIACRQMVSKYDSRRNRAESPFNAAPVAGGKTRLRPPVIPALGAVRRRKHHAIGFAAPIGGGGSRRRAAVAWQSVGRR